jgi:glucose-6-phosphate 1-epimerase
VQPQSAELLQEGKFSYLLEDKLEKQPVVDPTVRRIAGQGGLPMLEIDNEHTQALISLYGGHVLSYKPYGEEEVLFLSSKSKFEAGTPIRGGVPVCWPWFGPHATDVGKPMHGFARLSLWELQETAILEDGATRVVLELKDTAATQALWPHAFRLRLQVDAGSHLRIGLFMENLSEQPVAVSAALHSYFSVEDAEHVHITGLDDTFYIDTLQNGRSFLQRGKLQVNEEINRIYLETGNSCIIHDPLLDRQIVVKKEGSRSTVVWNPWQERSRSFADLGAEEYRHMVCIEAGNIRQDAVLLAPGTGHTLATEFTVIR